MQDFVDCLPGGWLRLGEQRNEIFQLRPACPQVRPGGGVFSRRLIDRFKALVDSSEDRLLFRLFAVQLQAEIAQSSLIETTLDDFESCKFFRYEKNSLPGGQSHANQI